MASFRRCPNGMPVALRSSDSAVGTIPGLAIDSMEACLGRARSLPANGVAPAMLAAPELLVTISLYWVKRRKHGGFAAAGDSVPGPLPTFSVVMGVESTAAANL